MTFATCTTAVLRRASFVLTALVLLTIAAIVPAGAQPAAPQQPYPALPGDVNTRERPLYGLTNQDAVRGRDLRGSITIPDTRAAVLVQPEGRDWRSTMKGPVRVVGSWLILGMVAALIAFYLLRGRITIEGGPSGRTIQRFNSIERFTHWFTASSFVVLGLSGLNITFGRYVLLPLLGPDIFTSLSVAAKYAHNFLAFPFMIGLVLMFVLWVSQNIPSRHDLEWFAAGGGLLNNGTHPPARKFNAGQKVVFWSVILGGGALSVTGIYLLFPFDFGDIHTQQLMALLHSVFALILIAIIIAHIYIGTLGMEGAWEAMGSGQVDERWAREHHNIWVAEVKGEPRPKYGSD